MKKRRQRALWQINVIQWQALVHNPKKSEQWRRTMALLVEGLVKWRNREAR